MVNRRAFLLGVASLPVITGGCIGLGANTTEFEISNVYIENRSTDRRRGTVAIEEADEVVFLDSIEVSPAEWDGDDLVREGGEIIETPVDGAGSYQVHVRIDDGTIHTTGGEAVQEDGTCVSVRPVIGRQGGFHFEYAYESGGCNGGSDG